MVAAVVRRTARRVLAGYDICAASTRAYVSRWSAREVHADATQRTLAPSWARVAQPALIRTSSSNKFYAICEAKAV